MPESLRWREEVASGKLILPTIRGHRVKRLSCLPRTWTG